MSDDSVAPFPDHIGAHAITIRDNAIHMTFHGLLRPEDARALTDLVDRLGSSADSHVFLVANLKDAGPPGPDARRAFASWRPHCHFHTVYFGAELRQQAFAELVDSAMRALGAKATRGRFVRTEEEALAAVAEEKKRLGI